MKTVNKKKDYTTNSKHIEIVSISRNWSKFQSFLHNSKRNHYQNFSPEHKQNMPKTWEGTKPIISINTTKNKSINCLKVNNTEGTDPFVLSSSFKRFSTTIAKKVESSIVHIEILYNNQYGFRYNHSAIHALIDITEKIRNALDKKCYASGVFTDLEKAFEPYYSAREIEILWCQRKNK